MLLPYAINFKIIIFLLLENYINIFIIITIIIILTTISIYLVNILYVSLR
jgi:hypothetical protein